MIAHRARACAWSQAASADRPSQAGRRHM